MRYVLVPSDSIGQAPGETVAIDEPYVDLVYGPLVGAMALLLLRYLHASLPLRTDPICTSEELAAASGSKPRRMAAPLRRLTRHRLIVLLPPTRGPSTRSGGRGPSPVGPPPELRSEAELGADAPTALVLPARLPLVSTRSLDRLPPLARRLAIDRRER